MGIGSVSTVVDSVVRDRAARWLGRACVRLPTFAELADPSRIPAPRRTALRSVDPDRPEPANLFRVHWYNDWSRTGLAATPQHLLLPPELTGVRPPIVMALGCLFAMIGAHKVLAAYGCLIPRLVTGRFDPTLNRAVWPSTGNYCRGGVAISRILGCRGIAVLPAGMSEERFAWLRNWVTKPEDIIRTPGSESNVKEIYDRCAELARDPANVILNQFAEFGNYVAHYACTGPALARVFEAFRGERPNRCLAAFVAASGSAGTLAAGDYLKEEFGTRIVAVEASECPTLLRNGFGEHNIQGIGDKHVPYTHNVMNTDIVVGVSDRSTGALDLLFNSQIALSYLADRPHLAPEMLSGLKLIGLSGIANLVAAIKTDSSALYASERRKFLAAYYPDELDTVSADEIFGQHLLGAADNDVLELTHDERSRIFNLGYYTWVEQQGVPLDAFERRRNQGFWREFRQVASAWDTLIAEFNVVAGLDKGR